MAERRSALAGRLHQIVELRRLAAQLEAPARDRLWRLARELRLEFDDSVPKLPAAGALGISVKALDKWIAKGALPTLRRPGAGRSRIETDAVLDLLEAVTDLREQGLSNGVVAAGVARLRQENRLRPKLRPNLSPAELRSVFEATAPFDRIRTAAELSYVQTRLAALNLVR